jgi:hypothetical protein
MLPGSYPPNVDVTLRGNLTLVGTDAIWPGFVNTGSGANATIRGLVIDGSNGQYAGGYWCALTSGTASLTLSDVAIQNVGYNGGTAELEVEGLCSVSIDRSDIEGLVTILGNSSLDISRTRFTGQWVINVNSVSEGLHLTMVNSLLSNTGVGGNLGSGSPTSNNISVYVAYNTFYDNSAATHAVACPMLDGTVAPGAITFTNNMIYAPSSQTAFVANPNCTADTNLVYPHSGSDNSGVNVIIADPKLVDAANGNYHLMPNSPAIDAAKPTGMDPNVDFDGTPRPQSSGYDIGAFEYKP